jgi:hypothetical protein
VQGKWNICPTTSEMPRYHDDDNESKGKAFLGAENKNQHSEDKDQLPNKAYRIFYSLLKARYTSRAAKRQLAILICFFIIPSFNQLQR